MAIDRSASSPMPTMAWRIPAMNAIPEQFTELTDPSVDYSKLFRVRSGQGGEDAGRGRLPAEGRQALSVEFTYASADSTGCSWSRRPRSSPPNGGAIGIDVKLGGLESQLWLDKVYKHRNFDVSMVSLTGRTDPMLGVDRSFLCNTRERAVRQSDRILQPGAR